MLGVHGEVAMIDIYERERGHRVISAYARYFVLQMAKTFLGEVCGITMVC
jgi:hypothetical protein